MSPVVLGGIATAVGGALLVGVGVAAGRWWNRRDWAAHRAYTARIEVELAEAERMIARFAQQNLDAAGADDWPLPDRVLLPPRKWAALREAQEHWEMN